MLKAINLNVWLERSEPVIEIRDAQTNEVILGVQGSLLHELLSSANISHDELYSEKSLFVVIIDELFSSHVSNALIVGSEDCERRKSYQADVFSFPGKGQAKEDDHLNFSVQESKLRAAK